MNKRKGILVAVILVAVVLMAVGYATLGDTPLNIGTTAQASANTDNFKVYFTGKTTSKSSEAEGAIDVTVTNGATNATVSFNKALGLDTQGESAYVILEIENGSEGIDAESIDVTTDGTDTAIFDFTSIMCNESGEEISNFEVASGSKTYVKVTVTLKTSPTADVETTTDVILTAKPKANV